MMTKLNTETKLAKKSFFEYLTCGDCLHDLERVLAFIVIIGVVVFGLISIFQFVGLDFGTADSFRFILERVLQLAIGVELARLLLSYNLDTVVELLAFVIARKLVLLENDFINLLFGIIALTILFGAKAILTYVESKEERLKQRKIENIEKNAD